MAVAIHVRVPFFSLFIFCKLCFPFFNELFIYKTIHWCEEKTKKKRKRRRRERRNYIFKRKKKMSDHKRETRSHMCKCCRDCLTEEIVERTTEDKLTKKRFLFTQALCISSVQPQPMLCPHMNNTQQTRRRIANISRHNSRSFLFLAISCNRTSRKTKPFLFLYVIICTLLYILSLPLSG